MSDDRAACDGEWELFDRTDHHGIAEQIEMCRTCPVINACLKLALDTPGRSGTWAGRYFAKHSQHRSERITFDGQIAGATEAELRAFHRDYYHGARDPLTLAGERAYSRSRYAKRATKTEQKGDVIDVGNTLSPAETSRIEATPRRGNAPRSIHSLDVTKEGLDVKSTHTLTAPASESRVA